MCVVGQIVFEDIGIVVLQMVMLVESLQGEVWLVDWVCGILLLVNVQGLLVDSECEVWWLLELVVVCLQFIVDGVLWVMMSLYGGVVCIIFDGIWVVCMECFDLL